MIWKQAVHLETFNSFNTNTLAEHLDIVFTEVGPDYIRATMPVSHKTVQPYRILHGGANVVLAETLGSVASTLCIENLDTHTAVGLEINANHLRSVREGASVIGTCRPIRIGRTVHVWQIEIHNEQNELCCVSRLTVSIIARK